jgi:hypothetical protein
LGGAKSKTQHTKKIEVSEVKKVKVQAGSNSKNAK